MPDTTIFPYPYNHSQQLEVGTDGTSTYPRDPIQKEENNYKKGGKEKQRGRISVKIGLWGIPWWSLFTHQSLTLRPTFYKFIVPGSQVQDPIHLGLGLQNVTLQLAPSVGRACALVDATVNHGRIKLLSVRVPREDHFGSGTCYTKASPFFPRTHSCCHNSASVQVYTSKY